MSMSKYIEIKIEIYLQLFFDIIRCNINRIFDFATLVPSCCYIVL